MYISQNFDIHIHLQIELPKFLAFCFIFSLHLTTMCLQYPPTVVACVCIHLASKWADYEVSYFLTSVH